MGLFFTSESWSTRSLEYISTFKRLEKTSINNKIKFVWSSPVDFKMLSSSFCNIGALNTFGYASPFNLKSYKQLMTEEGLAIVS